MTPQGKKAFFWGVNKHPNPSSASEKFVALAIVQDHRRGAHIVTSPDGIHWSCASAPFWQTPNDVSGKGDDCLMHMIYDQAKQKWALYRRIIPEFSERMIADDSDRERKAVDRYYRSYAYAESDDLREWKNHRFILSMDADDPADTELYQFGCHKIRTDLRRLHERVLSASPATGRHSSRHQPRRTQLHPRLPGRAVHPVGTAGILRLHGDGLFPARADHRRRYGLHLLRRGQFSAQRGRGAYRSRHAQDRRGAGHVQTRPVCLSGNERSGSRAVPRGDQTVHGTAPQVVPERGHLDEGIDPRGGIDARLAADSGLHRAAGAYRSRETPSTIRSAGTTTPT